MKINKLNISFTAFLLFNLFTISLVNAQTVPNPSGLTTSASLPDHDAPYCGSLVDPSLYDAVTDTQSANVEQFQNLELSQVTTDEECFFDCNQIVRGQVKDGIPSIDNPVFVDASSDGAPNDREKVIGVVLNGEARAYPYNILNWHEIVNDVFDGVHVSVTYCPLTGSGILYHTEAIGNAELGTSGFLYENNLVFYDRATDTEWSQMANVAVRGDQLGTKINYSESVETTWEAWKKLHPNTVVLSEDTGVVRDYARFPYGNYRSDGSIFFPTTYNSAVTPYNLYHEKALTQIVDIAGKTLLLPHEELNKIGALNHDFNGEDLFTAYYGNDALAITYSSNVNGEKLTFSPFEDISNALPSDLTLGMPIFIDNNDTIWNFNGLAISGPLVGEQLRSIPTYNAYWFAASTFFYDSTILQIDGDALEVITITQTLTTVSDGVTVTTTTEITSDNIATTSVTGLDPEVQDAGFVSFSPFYLLGFVAVIIPIYIRRKNR